MFLMYVVTVVLHFLCTINDDDDDTVIIKTLSKHMYESTKTEVKLSETFH